MDEEVRRQILDYARHYGLTDTDEPQEPRNIVAGTCLSEYTEILEDGLDWNVTAEHSFFTQHGERLQISADAARLLKQVFTGIDRVEPPDDLEAHQKAKQLRLDVPLLRSDHESDVQNYMGCRQEQSISSGLPLELMPVNDEADEGLSWSTTHQGLPAQYGQRLRNEKLAIDHDAVGLLGSALDLRQLQRDANNADLDLFSENSLKPIHNDSTRKLTPPLIHSPIRILPLSSSPIGALNDLMECCSSVSGELRCLRDEVLCRDQANSRALEEPLTSQFSSSPKPLNHDYPPSIPRTPLAFYGKDKKAWELKLDTPMTPILAPSSLDASSPDIVQEARLVTAVEETRHSSHEDEDLNRFFKEVIESKALIAKNDAEHEQLVIDSISRMTVPTLDMTLPETPWKILEGYHHESVNELMLPISRMKLHHWPGAGKIELNIPWAPFRPNLGRVTIQEDVGSEVALANILDISGFDNAIDRNDLAWKPDGLRLLDIQYSDDSELPLLFSSQKQTNMSHLGQKRKISSQFDLVIPSAYKDSHANPPTPPSKSQTVDDQPPGQELFSTSQELGLFMKMQGYGPKRVKAFDTSKSVVNVLEVPRKDPKATLQVLQQPHSQNCEDEPKGCQSFPFPVLGQDHEAANVLVSTKVLARRELMQTVRALSPTLKVIEREWVACEYQKNSQAQSRLDEGDVVFAPSQTIILTTLAAISQKSLPGQGSEPAVQSRIRQIAERFEGVHVLVEIPNGMSVNGADGWLSPAVTEFIVFCASVSGHVAVHCSAGGDRDLARWIVGVVNAYKLPATGTKLLSGGTLWEVFLRHAGLNAFGAQIVLEDLKWAKSDRMENECTTRIESLQALGLSAFVAMSPSERLQCFGRLLDGHNVLRRVNRILDAQWSTLKVR